MVEVAGSKDGIKGKGNKVRQLDEEGGGEEEGERNRGKGKKKQVVRIGAAGNEGIEEGVACGANNTRQLDILGILDRESGQDMGEGGEEDKDEVAVAEDGKEEGVKCGANSNARQPDKKKREDKGGGEGAEGRKKDNAAMTEEAKNEEIENGGVGNARELEAGAGVREEKTTHDSNFRKPRRMAWGLPEGGGGGAVEGNDTVKEEEETKLAKQKERKSRIKKRRKRKKTVRTISQPHGEGYVEFLDGWGVSQVGGRFCARHPYVFDSAVALVAYGAKIAGVGSLKRPFEGRLVREDPTIIVLQTHPFDLNTGGRNHTFFFPGAKKQVETITIFCFYFF